MSKLKIYTKSYCPYCVRALSVLKSAGVSDYDEISIDGNEMEMRQKLAALTHGRSDVPQVFLEDQYVGDDDALAALAQSGKLQTMLNGDA
ncbi:MAG: glutaredoxin 3 [Candidatus Latescibacteria bacterium]|jgi:glutaredoxin 3|nr:glutaredoxin 3 [Candidatus Latescibacterota bacterium]